MEIGVGLPSVIRDVAGDTVLEWAREADRAGFSSLATLDRLVYDNYDCLTTLAAAAAVTERARLATTIMISPLQANTALLAKQAATVDRLSGGRLVLGVAAGARPDDFRASGVPMAGRGRRVEAQVAELREIWSGARRGFAGGIGPTVASPPPILMGGHSPAALARTARVADGWISGGGGVDMFTGGVHALRAAWREAGREGSPRIVSLTYFALGSSARELADGYLNDYYGFAPPYAQLVARNAAVGEAKLTETLTRLRDIGCDEVVLAPCGSSLDQLKELREVVGK
ncbi:N5,N10-methylene tetrahydromethanopterin reductase [Actinophytocola xinjiangensis]|uniref:N5,N10-methylene tetrahydromethanopterin reductase n=1 Tax=Actinophytocola xinjiangensis TaxID=485602 RepID=A0A7Z0WGN0_9PSEU|nr:LLM class flavin-dependent oxidoreductase [Actinophytocola xinjiangensis]OLF05832.1 N5,N10-methylene tetrahydromethanopterin reductase [Actinophytocola xinjiangensis]